MKKKVVLAVVVTAVVLAAAFALHRPQAGTPANPGADPAGGNEQCRPGRAHAAARRDG